MVSFLVRTNASCIVLADWDTVQHLKIDTPSGTFILTLNWPVLVLFAVWFWTTDLPLSGQTLDPLRHGGGPTKNVINQHCKFHNADRDYLVQSDAPLWTFQSMAPPCLAPSRLVPSRLLNHDIDLNHFHNDISFWNVRLMTQGNVHRDDPRRFAFR